MELHRSAGALPKFLSEYSLGMHDRKLNPKAAERTKEKQQAKQLLEVIQDQEPFVFLQAERR